MLCASVRRLAENKNRLGQMRSVIVILSQHGKHFYKCEKSIKQENIDNIFASIMSRPPEIESASPLWCLIALDESLILSNY